jgi:outer membrane protein OmpA-like peptidoglycan-associated protein
MKRRKNSDSEIGAMMMPMNIARSWTRRVRRESFRWSAAFILVCAGVASISQAASSSSASKVVNVASLSLLGATVAARADNPLDATSYPSGTADASEPSGEAPMGPSDLPGYEESYVNDFNGTSLPSGWNRFSGEPGSDAGALWAPSHVQVSGGLLSLNTFQDPAFKNEWVAGGVCHCGSSHTYGAYFVRSRLTGPGPTQVELLWPEQNWPPEIDFDETFGDDASTMATVHYDSSNDQIQQTDSIDMTQWHTWGVIWTPTSITYTVDGVVWGSVTQVSAIPTQPMNLDIQQQTWCSSDYACPSSAQSTLVDWVAEYVPGTSAPATTTTVATAPVTTTTVAPATVANNQAAGTPVTVRPFAANSWALTEPLKAQIRGLAKTIRLDKASSIALVGFTDNLTSKSQALEVSRRRAVVVETYLEQRLQRLGYKSVTITVAGDGSSSPVASNGTAQGRSLNSRVVALIN